jgi:hypothetical protein
MLFHATLFVTFFLHVIFLVTTCHFWWLFLIGATSYGTKETLQDEKLYTKEISSLSHNVLLLEFDWLLNSDVFSISV